jgi:hypothetical protein
MDKGASQWIDGLKPGNESWEFTKGAAGAGRAVLGFGKDLVFGVGGLAVLAAKNMMPTASVQDAVDNAILAEDIRLGNVRRGSVKETGWSKAGRSSTSWSREPPVPYLEALKKAGSRVRWSKF